MLVSSLNCWEVQQEFLRGLEGRFILLSVPVQPLHARRHLRGLASPDCGRPRPLFHSELRSVQEHILLDLSYFQS